MSNTVAAFGNAAGETELPTQHWTTYLTLEAAEKPSFFKFMRQVALTERHSKNQPEKSDEAFAHEDIPNWSMAGIIYSLAKNSAQHFDDYAQALPLDKVLEAGIPIDICSEDDNITALHLVSYSTRVDNPLARETAEILLSKGARIDAQDDRKRTPLFIAASFLKRVPLIKLLIEKGADINSQDKNGRTPLSEAARLQPSDVSFLETIGFFASHPKIDWTLPGNTQKPIETLKRLINDEKDDVKKIRFQAALSLIQEPLIAHLQQQLAQQQRLPEGPASTPTALGDRAPS
jgi:hypothetical protein